MISIKENIAIIIAEIIFFFGVIVCYFVGLNIKHIYGWYPFSFIITMFVFINLISGISIYCERKAKQE